MKNPGKQVSNRGKQPPPQKKDGKDGKDGKKTKTSKSGGGKGMNLLKKIKEGTAKAKNKLSVKKKGKKKKDDSSSSSSSTSATSAFEVRADNPFLSQNQQKRVIPGALQNVAQMEGMLQKLLADERPDMDLKGLNEMEATMLDNYLRQHSELIGGDCIYTEDNNDEDNRSFVRYEIQMKYNEGRYAAIYIAIRSTCVKNVVTADENAFLVKMALRKSSARAPFFITNEAAILKEVGNKRFDQKKVPYTPIHIDAGRICDMPYIVMNCLDRNIAKLKEDCGGKFTALTAIYIGIETLNAIADLHGKNYIHRDIKPTNFCAGIEDGNRKLFLIDFGDACKKGDKQTKLGVPDGLTLPYWSLEVHLTGKCSERGDVESWFYLLVEMAEPKAMPWVKLPKMADVEAAKKKFWAEYKQTLTNRTLLAVADCIGDKQSMSFPKDYQTMKKILQDTMDEGNKTGKWHPEWVKSSGINAADKDKKDVKKASAEKKEKK